ncbi:MAG: hypothetical protein HY812_11815 [Planctomycetes bacterium]|nr:hypothetical protein [Planctomycetota bacterium]
MKPTPLFLAALLSLVLAGPRAAASVPGEWALTSALPGAPVLLLFSPYPGPFSTPYGTLGVGPQAILVFAVGAVSGAGDLLLLLPVPSDSAAFDFPLNLQCAVLDAGNPTGYALSNSVNEAFWGADLDADADRDGSVEPASAEDDEQEDSWSSAKGAVFLYNNDDDDLDGNLDSSDAVMNGVRDELDLAALLVRPIPSIPAGWTGEISVDSGAAHFVRLFRNLGGGAYSLFDPATHNPLANADLAAGVAFGVEALDYAQTASGAPGKWSGEALLTLVLKDGSGSERSRDEVRLRVSPFLLYSNLAQGQKAYVVKKTSTQPFIAQLGPAVSAAQVALHVIDGIVASSYDVWAQDAMEFGYSTLPAPTGARTAPAVLRSPRGQALDAWTKDHWLGVDCGYAYKGWKRSGVGWIDWFGNLDCTPPLPGWPLGRVYTGYQGALTMHPAVLEFLDAQAVQGPVLQINTGWLLIGHVDEEVCFVPANSGSPYRMLVPSTSMALGILQDLQNAGKGGLTVFAGKSDQTTVAGILADSTLVAYNQGLQPVIDGVRGQLKTGLGVAEADIIDVPALFSDYSGGKAVAYMPNIVNSLVLGTHFISADPFGPVDGGVDKFKEPVVAILSAIGMTAVFVDDWYPYHQWLGEVHCGTNAVRAAPATPWWTVE